MMIVFLNRLYIELMMNYFIVFIEKGEVCEE